MEKITDEHHVVFGGRSRRDFRFWNNEVAVEIRKFMADIKERSGFNSGEIAQLIDEGPGSLSHAAGGKIGDMRLKEIRNKLNQL